MISKKHQLSLVKQCQALKVKLFYQSTSARKDSLKIMKVIDKLHLKQPFLGVRRIADELRLLVYDINH